MGQRGPGSTGRLHPLARGSQGGTVSESAAEPRSAAAHETARELITCERHPDRYRHWRLAVEARVATLSLDVDEAGGLAPGYRLKLNSYDLGVDIELHDALQRIRFEHPQVGCVVLTSAKERVFSAGANIFMLGLASHAEKVNFCKFTNETRNGMEESSAHSGLKFLAACNGTTAGGGYELALACDQIVLVDDRWSAVSLPEVPLLGVLPGTGGLTRLTDKRRVRRDQADLFCTSAEGVRGARAREWRLVDEVVKPGQFHEFVGRRAAELAEASERPRQAQGIVLPPLERRIDAAGYHYALVDARIEREARRVTLTVSAPERREPEDIEGILARGAHWWPLRVARELDDAVLMLRMNDPEVGTWLLSTRGDADRVLEADASLERHGGHWFVKEVTGMLRRTLSRLDVSSRSLIALVDRGSCFAGTLFELALAADRSYMLQLDGAAPGAPCIACSPMNFGAYPAANGAARIETRFCGERGAVEAARAALGRRLDAERALALGLVTAAPDELDWDEEIRLALEERASLSPDALTGLEANLRFPGAENMHTRIFGRLSAWQNWIFTRPNATGAAGALKVFGTGSKPGFDWNRT
ncbi:MAG: benzoyl-CoA-dihydrodiol lyase [Burkholderiales bacterium]|nr:benzoyl-CoA-dihydrodiol lyase [Burkholderiales bacterium]